MNHSELADRPDRIVIVGGGFSATALALQLLRQAGNRKPELLILDPRPRPGRGLAYSTLDDNLVLNVPAGNMSVWLDEPDDFVTYCRNLDPALSAASFLPRRIYGNYLECRLADMQAASGVRVTWLQETVTAVQSPPQPNQMHVVTASGRQIEARRVVLCLGHFPSRPLSPALLERASDRWIGDPWEGLDAVDVRRPVLLLGSGLTAIDTAFRLSARGIDSPLLMLSRRGLLPQGHRQTPKPPSTGEFPLFLEAQPLRVRSYVRALREELAAREQAGGNWRDLINELRPHTPAIWQRFSQTEQQYFLRHLLPFWDVHRHRLAPCAYRRLQDMLASGQVELLAGRVLSFVRDGSEVAVAVRERRGGCTRMLSVGTVINCTGPNANITTVEDPLVRQLQQQGLARPDPLRLGLDVDAGYRLLDRSGRSQSGLYYLGPFLKARYWEAIAVPELRVHAARLAGLLLES